MSVAVGGGATMVPLAYAGLLALARLAFAAVRKLGERSRETIT